MRGMQTGVEGWDDYYEAGREYDQQITEAERFGRFEEMDVSDKLSGKYLRAEDLRGKRVPVVIEGVTEELIGQDDNAQQKLVVFFRDREKALVLNQTNLRAIAQMYGTQTDDWAGKTVKLYPTTTQFQGQTVPCIRVQVDVPEATESDEIPF